MATAIFGSPLKKVYGESVALSTTAVHLAVPPGYHEVELYCPTNFRMSLCPRLGRVLYYNASTYTDYTSSVTDRSSSTHMPLDGMTTAHKVYLGVTDPVRGFYFDIGTNVQDNAATLDVEYMYDWSNDYFKITGTVSAAFTVGETVTGGTSGTTATHVYDDGATYIIVKNLSGSFTMGETISGAAQNISTTTAFNTVPKGTGYFTDVAGDSDGTDVAGDTLKQDGLYSFTLPSVVNGGLTGISGDPLYWYRFTPSATLSATTDINEIIPAADSTNYGYYEESIKHRIPINVDKVGALEFDLAYGDDTLEVTWIKH